MKKLLLLAIGIILLSQMANAQAHYLGTFITNRWVNDFYPNSFSSNKPDGVYTNAIITGQVNSTCDVILETDKDNILRTITYKYKNLTSEQAVRDAVNGLLGACKIYQTIVNEQGEKRISYCFAISPNLKTLIMGSASWDYNDFNQFFFYKCEVKFTL